MTKDCVINIIFSSLERQSGTAVCVRSDLIHIVALIYIMVKVTFSMIMMNSTMLSGHVTMSMNVKKDSTNVAQAGFHFDAFSLT